MHTVQAGQELFSLEEAAEFLCVSKSTMYRLLDQGKLRGMKAGKQWRLQKDEMLAYMQRGPSALALANVPMAVLEAELDFFADALAQAGSSAEEADDPALEGEAGNIAQLVRRMVWLLCIMQGSDLHVEPVWDVEGARVVVRLRVAGMLHEVRRLPFALHEVLILEWKRLAGLASEERERPQNGSTWLAFPRQHVRLRVSIVPTVYGEKLAVRYIPSSIPSMEDLGLADTSLLTWIQHHEGLILFTGPTGAGKVTTQASCVRELLPKGLNIMTVEGPIEYIFPHGVTHLKVEQYSHAEGMRAIMQQDPDVIVVGGIDGDPELAQLTVWAAETGHLVMTTMHAHDAISPLYELLNWGVKRSLLTSNIIGIVNQRLLFKLCPVCKAPHTPDPALLKEIRKTAEEGGYHIPESAIFFQPAGCDDCQGIGYAGRFALHEYFTFSPALRAAFLRGVSIDEFTTLVRADRQLSSFAAGIKQTVNGITSLDEVMRKVSRWRA
jgi:excisionase family DNA binding protein